MVRTPMLEALPGATLRVHDWLRENVVWHAADATSRSLIDVVGEQDIVIANNYIGPMEDPLADASKPGWPWIRWGHEPLDRNREA
jgi:hypothetical protein